MKTLIYTVACGPLYIAQAGLLHESLRRFGNFKGVFRVYGEPEVRFIPSPEHSGYMGRVLVGKNLNFSHYDRVLYLDSDILVWNDINPLLELDGLRAFQEARLDKTNWGLWLPGDTGYPAMEWGWNSGTVLSVGWDWHNVCRKWWDEIMAMKAWTAQCWDQNAFNGLILKQQLDVKPIPREWVYFTHWDSGQRKPEIILMHFNAGGDPLTRLGTMIHGLQERSQ